MSILIIGGAGFIGRELSKSLLNAGLNVVIKTRDSDKARALFNELDCITPHIIENYSDLKSIKSKPKAAICLAGEGIIDKRWSDHRKKELIDSRVLPLLELKDYLEQSNTKLSRLLVGSAIGYYGYNEQEPNAEHTETSELKPAAEENSASNFAHTLCATLENTAEQLRSHCDTISMLRTGVVLGHGGALHKMSKPAKYHLNGKIGNGKQWVSWIHIQDWVKAAQYILALETPRSTYNLCSPNPVLNLELSQAIGKAIGKNFQMPTPAAILKLVLGEASILLTGSQKVIPANLQAANFVFDHPNIEQACEDLLKVDEALLAS